MIDSPELSGDEPQRLALLPYGLASLVAVILTVITDATGAAVGLALIGVLGAKVLPYLIVGAAAALAPATVATAARLRTAAAMIVSVVPVAYAAYYIVPSMVSEVPEALPVMIGMGAAFVFVLIRWAGRLHLPDNASFWLAACAAGVQLVALLLATHIDEETFSMVNPGTGRERELAYLATWGLSLLLLLPWSHAIWLRTGAEVSRVAAAILSAVVFVAALLLLFANRTYMVGLHESLHLWLIVVAALSLDAGLSLWLGTRGQAPLRRRLAPAGGIALAVLAVSAGVATLTKTFNDERVALAEGSFAYLLSKKQAEPGAETGQGACTWTAIPCAKDHTLLSLPKQHDYERPPTNHNILLVTVDALRADFVLPDPGARRAKRAPYLAQLASESVNFVNGNSTGTRTAIGMGCLMSGRYSANLTWDKWLVTGNNNADYDIHAPGTATPEDFEARGTKVRGYTTFPRWSEFPTLAQRLQKAGFRTMGVPYGGARASTWFAKGGFELGYDQYNPFEGAMKNATPRVVDIALQQIDDSGDRRWFQWVHLYDTHDWGSKKRTYQQLAHKVDEGVKRLVEGLEQRGLLDNTVVVLTSDHGVAFGEHRAKGHASSVYWEQTRVPILIRIPGVKPRRILRHTSTLDAVATILALGGASLENIDGMNLLPLADGEDVPTWPVFTELHRYKRGERGTDLHAVLQGRWKLILDRKTDTAMLFDLKNDKRETTNVLAEHPDVVDDYGRLLSAFLVRGESEHPLP